MIAEALTVFGATVGAALVDYLAVVVGNYDTAVGSGDPGLTVDVFAELVIDALGRNPRRDPPVARGERHPSDMLTTVVGIAVHEVVTGACWNASGVNVVFTAGVLTDDGKEAVALGENGHTLGESANVSV